MALPGPTVALLAGLVVAGPATQILAVGAGRKLTVLVQVVPQGGILIILPPAALAGAVRIPPQHTLLAIPAAHLGILEVAWQELTALHRQRAMGLLVGAAVLTWA
jgi:hypothetical protein